MHYRPSLQLSAAVVSCCRCFLLLVPSLLVPSLLVPSLLRAATRFSGTAFGLRPALAKSRRSGQPTHRRSEGTRFLNRLEGRPALAKYRRNGQPTHRRSEGHGEPVRKYLISQFGSFLSYTEGRYCPAMLIFGQAVAGLGRAGAEEGAERKEEDGLESETLGHPPMVLRTADY